jgi:two-component system copper resistance phosphate regulon response regulator CusR
MKVLYIEDEIKTAQSLKKGLEEHYIQVDFAYDGETGLQMVRKGSYDVVISDIIMPGMSGLNLVRLMRSEGINTPVLMLTALDSTDSKVAGLEAGADDYLAKPFEFAELLARVRALGRRKGDLNMGQTLTYLDIEMDLRTRVCTRAGKTIELTPREFSLLEYLIRNQGRVISKTEIAEEVWNLHFETSTNVIEVYVNYLRNKVDRPFGDQIILTVFGVGYLLKAQQ